MKLIDKDALVAEIGRLRKEDGNPYFPSETADKYYARGVHFTCDGLVNFLDTLEVKEVDLDEEIEKCLKRYNMLAVGKKDFTDIAKHFFELGMQVSNKAQKGE